ncbi:MAG: peptidase T [Lachnospiraceae bacterium]|uniref:Peptidase T n=1 Tax=Candidatus Weimeria bifida TaxID=2599074 RepID=A0A6N7IXE5_9FIRM|nr:peptidase T [Candidatus Weimeria bifida]RRF97137.1 MAG: peptidase T [Lachnospiraceae bacterium]
MTLLDRFFKYVSVWTTSEEGAKETPSTKRQLDLAAVLEKELKEIGVPEVSTEKGYVYGHLPASPEFAGKKAVAFISHMDTAPDFNGQNVHPQVFENYDGKDILLKGSGATLSTKDFPDLLDLKGRTLITTDGTSLLGADDKAGDAEIMTAVSEIISEKVPHGDIYIVFTPDEEIGKGPVHFSFEKCRADYGYTVDGDYEGEVAYENFNAASAKVTIKGKSVHPGEAKDIMKNAASIACEFQSLMPQAESPEHTEKREGFYYLTDIKGSCEKAELDYIIRDHDSESFKARKKFMTSAADLMNQRYGEGTADLTITDEYQNMIEVMKDHEDVIEAAREAIRSIGLEPLSRPVRGGTDGAQLSFKGLPCPNLGTGGYGFHGPFEHCTLEGMQDEVRIIKYLMRNPL